MDLIEAQVFSLALDENGGIAQLQDPHALGIGILAGLEGHALDARGAGKDAVDQAEFFEKHLQAVHRLVDQDELPKLRFGAGRRQKPVRPHPLFHRFVANGAFDMAVEFDLGERVHVHGFGV